LDYNEIQKSDNSIPVKNLQIINGGQTCMTIFDALTNPKQTSLFDQNEALTNAMVLFRLYQLPSSSGSDDLVAKITYATNSQNPVDLRDLKANDAVQKNLGLDIDGLGFNYRRKKSDAPYKPTDITIGTAAEAVLAVWLRKPHQAKFFAREHFGKLYNTIFNDKLNGAQVITAVLLYRIAENHRRRPGKDDPTFTRYASSFIAMQMGAMLLQDTKKPDHTQIGHKDFDNTMRLIDGHGEGYFGKAVSQIDSALGKLYGDNYAKSISLQQLSATFRRGDLLEYL
jgi:hypothetical protein